MDKGVENNPETTISDEIQAAIINISDSILEGNKVSFLYKLGIFGVAIFMLLLPLVYIGLIVLTGWGVYYHATANSSLFEDVSGQGAIFFYVTPLVVGVVLIFFMLKPLFAKRVEVPSNFPINLDNEPLLKMFIHKICMTVGAPLPKAVDVNCDVNASASFHKGFWSLFSQDLNLTIGLPLVAGMDVRSVGGILAHEFGHFAQGTGMRFTFIIRRINAWFSRVVYERDEWDQKLAEWSQGIDLRIGIILYCARMMIWVTRKILWLLMLAGHGVSSFMLRQMEYDADSYEIRFAGSEHFDKTSKRLALLGYGQQFAINALQESWNERRLTNNYSQFVVTQTNRIPPETVQKIEKAGQSAKTGFFDSHPCDSDRTAAALKINAPGVFHCELPATGLFENFDELSKKATHFYYQNHFGLEVSSKQLVDNEALERETDAKDRANKIFDELFKDVLSLRQLPELDKVSLGADETDSWTTEKYIAFIKEFEEVRDTSDALRVEYATIVEKQTLAMQAVALIEARFKIDAKEFCIEKADNASANQTIDLRKKELDAANLELSSLRYKASAVIKAAVKLINSDVNIDEQVKQRVALAIAFINKLNEIKEDIAELLNLFFVLDLLVKHLDPNENSDAFIATMRSRAGQLHDARVRFINALLETQYPFEHSSGEIQVAAYLSTTTDPSMDIIFREGQASQECLQRLTELYFRCISYIIDNANNCTVENAPAAAID